MTAFPPQSILGIDIAKAKADTQFQRVGSAEKPLHRIYDNTPAGHEQVVTWLATHHVGQLHVCLEATGTYGDALALRLHQAGYRVSIVNPLRIKRYGESELLRIKSDKTDAALIARFCLTQHPDPWTPPPQERRHLQDLVAYVGLCPHPIRSCPGAQSLVLPGVECHALQSSHQSALSVLAGARQTQAGGPGRCHAQTAASDLWRAAFRAPL